MIQEKYVKFNEQKYYFQYGKTSVNEVLQHNIGKQYPEQFEMFDSNLQFNFIQHPYHIPPEAVEKMYKTAEIKMDRKIKVLTAIEGSNKFRLLLDFNGV